jgi:hypothetical protein
LLDAGAFAEQLLGGIRVFPEAFALRLVVQRVEFSA